MDRIGRLENRIQEYAWGSRTAIPRLLGKKSGLHPQAELWMGAHPKAPSLVSYQNIQEPLDRIIRESPETVLGKKIAEKFNNRFPFLFKVLAAAKPLSLQAHPDRKQARRGFKKENDKGIPFNADNRNYKDENHKPECICAITEFWALNGFRNISKISEFIRKIELPELNEMLMNQRDEDDAGRVNGFFRDLMLMDSDRKKQIVDTAVKNIREIDDDDPVFYWMQKLSSEYPGDIGVLSPILLNLVCLKPGQAMFLEAGELHSYLDGLGIEIMANSDNVLRGGLTSKHIDVKELLNILKFKEKNIEILTPEPGIHGEGVYRTQAEEFVLSRITITNTDEYLSALKSGVEILLCIQGQAVITDLDHNDSIQMNRGSSVIIPYMVKKYKITGKAAIYKAAVPGD